MLHFLYKKYWNAILDMVLVVRLSEKNVSQIYDLYTVLITRDYSRFLLVENFIKRIHVDWNDTNIKVYKAI